MEQKYIAISLFIWCISTNIAYTIFIQKIIKRIRENHPDIYSQIGEYSLVFNNSIKNNWLFMKFIITRKFKNLGDPYLEKVSNITLFLLIIGVLSMLIFFGAISQIPGVHFQAAHRVF